MSLSIGHRERLQNVEQIRTEHLRLLLPQVLGRVGKGWEATTPTGIELGLPKP